MTPSPNRPYDTDSRDVAHVEFEVTLDEWRTLTPEELEEVFRHVPPRVREQIENLRTAPQHPAE